MGQERTIPRRNRRFTRTAAVILGIGCMGCMHQPQTRQEFVKLVAGGAATSDKESKLTQKDLDSLVTLLEERSKACLGKRVNRSGMVGGQMEVSGTSYTPSVRRVSDAKAEFTLQLEHSPRGIGPDMPAGGFYMMAADLVRQAPERTQVDLYYATMAQNSDEILGAVRAWTSGEPAACPELE